MKKPSKIFLICVLLLVSLAIGCSTQMNKDIIDETQISSTTEKMVEGELIELSPDRLLIKQADGSESTLILTDDTIYWEGLEWLTVFPIDVGDQVTAYGEWTKDHSSFMVEQYYDNRVILKGIVTYSSGEAGGYMLNQPGQEFVIFPLPERTELLTHIPEDARSMKYFKLLPRPAEYLEVVGRKVSDQYVVAVKMTRFE